MEPTTILREPGAPEQSHHVAAGIAYLALAFVPVVLALMQHRTPTQPGVLLPAGVLGFLATCAFYRARFGDDSLPDRMERVRRATVYSLGVFTTACLAFYAIVSIGKLF